MPGRNVIFFYSSFFFSLFLSLCLFPCPIIFFLFSLSSRVLFSHSFPRYLTPISYAVQTIFSSPPLFGVTLLLLLYLPHSFLFHFQRNTFLIYVHMYALSKFNVESDNEFLYIITICYLLYLFWGELTYD